MKVLRLMKSDKHKDEDLQSKLDVVLNRSGDS